MGILLWTLGFALVAFVTMWFRESLGDFDYLTELGIPFESRLERLKASVAFWQGIIIFGGAGYLAFLVSWLYALWFTTLHIVKSDADIFLLGEASILEATAFSICVVVGPLAEAFLNFFACAAKLSTVNKQG
jgi:hypothetical protein